MNDTNDCDLEFIDAKRIKDLIPEERFLKDKIGVGEG